MYEKYKNEPPIHHLFGFLTLHLLPETLHTWEHLSVNSHNHSCNSFNSLTKFLKMQAGKSIIMF